MLKYFKKRKTIKTAKEILRHATHLRNMREDLMKKTDFEALADAEQTLRKTLGAGELKSIEDAGDALYTLTQKLSPPRKHPVLRENLEILVVAITVAMGVRTYFLQPFKIPTGSMQPTLYGITSRYQEKRAVTDYIPINFLKWFATGELYRCVKVKTGGIVEKAYPGRMVNDPANFHYWIAEKKYRVPVDAFGRDQNVARLAPGMFVNKGDILWSGIIIAGDHVFVDKMRWNFFKPKRDQVVVFNTNDIDMTDPVPKGTHYIKRLVGLSGDTMSIQPPRLLVNGDDPEHAAGIARVVNQYGGYRTINGGTAASRAPLRRPGDSISLRDREFFALGDNQRSSKDGRYWGTVPGRNLVGPGWIVYWPFMRREKDESRHGWQAGILGLRNK